MSNCAICNQPTDNQFLESFYHVNVVSNESKNQYTCTTEYIKICQCTCTELCKMLEGEGEEIRYIEHDGKKYFEVER